MAKKILLLFFSLYFMWGSTCANASDINQKMMREARIQLIKIVDESRRSRMAAQKIFDVADEKAKLCVDAACAYPISINGIYEVIARVGLGRRCPLSAKALGGVWLNAADTGYYEKITLSLYKSRPSAHQFIIFKSKGGGNVEDGFGGWVWRDCKIETIEHKSVGGRIFNPGNDLVVVSYSESTKVLTLLDGYFLASYVRQE
jgi:hypothetical protein